MGSSRRIKLALLGLVVLVLGGWFVQDMLASDDVGERDSGLPTRALSELPGEAAGTWRLIEKGGPFPHDEDGAVFDNRERRLPEAESTHYREYTVETPGSGDRGGRRLVTGSDGELYYTGDHYRSFVAVDPQR